MNRCTCTNKQPFNVTCPIHGMTNEKYFMKDKGLPFMLPIPDSVKLFGATNEIILTKLKKENE